MANTPGILLGFGNVSRGTEGPSARTIPSEVSRETEAEVLTRCPGEARIGVVPWRLGFPA
jgi:hypothetical protein